MKHFDSESSTWSTKGEESVVEDVHSDVPSRLQISAVDTTCIRPNFKWFLDKTCCLAESTPPT